MTQSVPSRILSAAVVSLIMLPAHAALQGRLPATPGGIDYQAYYDTATGLTWLADANYAQTSGYDADGQMNWSDAKVWAASLDINGITGWRLPDTLQPDPSCSVQSGGQSSLFSCTGSEMGRLFHISLGNPSSGPLINTSPFSNIQSDFYSSSTEAALNPTAAWVFDFGFGNQGTGNKTDDFHAWAVYDGDVANAPSADVSNYEWYSYGAGQASPDGTNTINVLIGPGSGSEGTSVGDYTTSSWGTNRLFVGDGNTYAWDVNDDYILKQGGNITLNINFATPVQADQLILAVESITPFPSEGYADLTIGSGSATTSDFVLFNVNLAGGGSLPGYIYTSASGRTDPSWTSGNHATAFLVGSGSNTISSLSFSITANGSDYTRVGVGLLVEGTTVPAWESTLHGRNLDGNPSTAEAYYDSVLDITWLADANYAQTSGYDADGLMDWTDANFWAAGLNPYSSGITGWRLPDTVDVGNDGSTYTNLYQGVDLGFNITTHSEMSHMFYETLGNLSLFDTSGNNQPGGGLTNTGPFSNLQRSFFWSATEYAPNTILSWIFDFDSGNQSITNKIAIYYTWAVHDGDVGTPLSTDLIGVLPATPGGTDYQAYYDPVADLSWLADANYAQTSGYDADGLMNWADANAWAAGLSINGVSGWRLPSALNSDGSGPCGPDINCSDSEMGNLYYNVLGNAAGGPLTNTGPFSNVQSYFYWSSTVYAPGPTAAWVFDIRNGGQAPLGKASSGYAWAVQSGNVADQAPILWGEDFESCELNDLDAIGDYVFGNIVTNTCDGLGAGMQVFMNVYDPLGNFLYNYGAFPAPNNAVEQGAMISGLASGEGGLAQGDKQLNFFNDYNNLDHYACSSVIQPTDCETIEANIYKEWVIRAIDLGRTYVFRYSYRSGSPPFDAVPGTTNAFIRTIEPFSGNYYLTNEVLNPTDDRTSTWIENVEISIYLDPAIDVIDNTTGAPGADGVPDLLGQLLQVGFNNTASSLSPSGMWYDNLLFYDELVFIDPDTDGDGLADNVDNCIYVANPGQQDTDGDGHGNICDADFDNSCLTNAVDLGIFKGAFFTNDPDVDMDSSGLVNGLDLGLFKAAFFQAPGPSAPGALCP